MQDGGPVSKTLGAVPREFANLEAEKGEVIATQDKGDLALFTIGGKRHSEGGTPMRRPAGDFIWSDTKKMKIKDEDILKEFGASKAATPAKLAKKFLDTNDYRAILDDPKSDDMAKKTAAMMLEKNKEKLARLAFVQEEMKGFPQGIPGIAQDYAASIGVPMAQYGGVMLPKAQDGLTFSEGDKAIIDRYKAKQRLESSWAPGSYGAASRIKFKPEEIEVINRYLNLDETSREAINRPAFTQQSSSDEAAPRTEETPVSRSQPDLFGAPGRSMSESMFGTPGANFPQYTPVAPGQSFLNTPSEPARPSTSSSAKPAQGSVASGTSGRVDVYSPGVMQQYEAGQDAPYYTFTPGSGAIVDGQSATRPARQGLRPDGTFGENDLTSPAVQADLYKRHPWIKEQRPDFDLTNDDDVLWYQRTGEARRKEIASRNGTPYIPYFTEDGVNGTGFDGKMGAHSINLPTEDVTEPPTTLPKKTPQIRETEEDMVVPEVRKFDPRETKPFEQDLRNERVLARNRLSERKRYPWRGRLAGRAADPLYQSDVNQQQNLQAQQAIASAAAASFADPNALMANLSRLSGLTGDNSNQIAAQIQRENTNIGNQFERFNTELAGQTDVRNLANTQNLYDMTVKTDEVFDEKMRNYNVAQGRQRNITDTNLARAKAMNKLNPLYTINTGEGPQFGDIQFQPGVSTAMFQPGQASASEQQKAYIAAQRQAIQDDLTLTPEDRSKLMGKLYEQELGLLNPKSTGNISPEQAAAMYQYQQMMGTVGIPQSTYGGYQTPSMRMGGESKRKKRY